MTIAISLKVNDGLVLAADSAGSLSEQDAGGQPTGVVNVYNNANKVFHLKKGLPIGGITWGAGSIGTAAISTLAKDLRRRFEGSDPDRPDWEIQPGDYELEAISRKVREFMFDEHYVEATKDWPEGEGAPPKPSLGLVVAGYSAGQSMAEEYQFVIGPEASEPTLLRPKDQTGMTWNGQPEAISRFVLGVSPSMDDVLRDQLGVPGDQVAPAMEVIRGVLSVPLVNPAMPFQDAIDLAEFLVDLTIKFSRFAPGAPTVGGPIEVAAISKHEGFKWIRRKHYFSKELNPEP